MVGYLRLWALELLLVELPSQCYMPATSQRQEEHFKLLSLLKLIRNSYEIDMILEGKDTDFDIWCQEKCDEYCKRCFFFPRWVNFREFVFLFHSENQRIKLSVTFVLRCGLRYAFYLRYFSQIRTLTYKWQKTTFTKLIPNKKMFIVKALVINWALIEIIEINKKTLYINQQTSKINCSKN